MDPFPVDSKEPGLPHLSSVSPVTPATPVSPLRDTRGMLPKDRIPFLRATQLDSSLDGKDPTTSDMRLPGHPRIRLSASEDLYDFVDKDLSCPKLDRMAPRLWLVSRRSPAAVNALHRQALRGRAITPMEDVDLHLVWRHDRMFIKPLPEYLLSFDFWDRYLTPSPEDKERLPTDRRVKMENITRAASGLLRSYFYLIQHRSDLRLAHQHGLIPLSVKWEHFCAFSAFFGDIPDSDVAPRYHYSELGLYRLNSWVTFLLGKLWYQETGIQDADRFAPFYAPILFFFASFSIVLNAMQVGLTAQQLDPSTTPWFPHFSFQFAYASIHLTAWSMLFLALCLFTYECSISVRNRWAMARKKND